MLTIRMQRTGRKGHASFRVVVQDSRQAPTSGKFVALLGNYDPHTKNANLATDKVAHYLQNGAQPSERAAKLFQSQGIELPSWVKIRTERSKTIRHQDKLRKNQPEAEADESSADLAETPAEAAPAEA